MCPGMRPAPGWIANFTSTPRLAELVVELAHLVLGLRHGHAVARDDHHELEFSAGSAAAFSAVSGL
jgi:hypothetical protein